MKTTSEILFSIFGKKLYYLKVNKLVMWLKKVNKWNHSVPNIFYFKLNNYNVNIKHCCLSIIYIHMYSEGLSW